MDFICSMKFPHNFPMKHSFLWVSPYLFDSQITFPWFTEPHNHPSHRSRTATTSAPAKSAFAARVRWRWPKSPWENPWENCVRKRWENGDLYGKLTVCYGKSPFLMGKSTTVFLLNGFFLPRRLFFTGAEMWCKVMQAISNPHFLGCHHLR